MVWLKRMRPKGGQYLLPQMGRDRLCHCLPFLHLEILQHWKPNFSPAEHQWRSEEIWHGQIFEGLRHWQQALDELTNPKPEHSRDFNEYQHLLLISGITLHNMYTKRGKQYVRASLNPLQNLQRFWLAPYHYVDPRQHDNALQKSLPIYSDGKCEWIYDPHTAQYQPLQPAKRDFEQAVFLATTGRFYRLTPEQWQYLGLPRGAHLRAEKLRRGGQFKYVYCFQFLPQQARSYINFHVGLYQLMLFAMGLDNDNRPITAHHAKYRPLQNFKQTMAKYAKSPWNSTTFCKQNLLEYHLAEILIQNPTLTAELKTTINCCFNTWQHYVKLPQLYDQPCRKQRRPLSERAHTLPGEAQILAYSLAQCLRLLWSAAVSQTAFYGILELPRIVVPLTYLPGFSNSKKVIPAAYKLRRLQQGGRLGTFIETWHKIKYKLKLRQVPEHLVTFDGHGAILSFDPHLLTLQNQMPIAYPKVMQDLGFTVIDSLYADAIRPFYAKPGATRGQVGCNDLTAPPLVSGAALGETQLG